MVNVTKTVRETIISIVEESAEYDASTVKINKEGDVSAKKDQNKTTNHDNARYVVGNVSDMVDENGNKQAGW